jgi:hypothetical protein
MHAMGVSRHLPSSNSYRYFVLALLLNLAIHRAKATDATWTCTAPDSYGEADLRMVANRSCNYVATSISDFRAAIQSGSATGLKAESEWAKAETFCNSVAQSLLLADSGVAADALGEMRSASNDALKAWGLYMTDGSECCNSVLIPYCTDSSTWLYTLIATVPLALVTILILTSTLVMAVRKPIVKEQPAPLKEIAHVPISAIEEKAVAVKTRHDCRLQLEEMWLRHSCLRVLPGAKEFASATSSLLAALHETFDFQWGNVQNQFEHLLSAWRSHCAMVADRHVELDAPVPEDRLLQEALGDLHSDLLEGFSQWRQHTEALPPLGGAAWDTLKATEAMPADACAEMSRQLAEIMTYLLVWGECGNLRFMPEMVYFLTELVLTAESPGSHDVSDTSLKGLFRSGAFLAKVVRPVYNVIFDEWYDQVEMDGNLTEPTSRRMYYKDKKKLRPGFETFLPADVANYDDWNELFIDQNRLVDSLFLSDGSKLYAMPPGKRYAALPNMDWQTSLKAEATKTHREIHSLWGLFAATHRIWLLHAVLFFATACIVADSPEEKYWNSTLKVPVGVAKFSTMCLLVPFHALLQYFACWQVAGHAVRSTWSYCTGSLWNLVLAAPLGTYLCIILFCALDFHKNVLFTIVVVHHYAISLLGLFQLLLRPSVSDSLWPLTKVSVQARVVRYLFWFLVLAAKCTMGLLATQALVEGIKELRLTVPGHETPRDSLFLISHPHSTSNVNFLLFAVAWAVNFLLYVTDTQLWFVIGCSILGLLVVFAQRGWHLVSFVCEDAVAKIPERFTQKVLKYTTVSADLKSRSKNSKPFSEWFPHIWDRIVEYMRYEDDIDFEFMGDLSFISKGSSESVTWSHLTRPLSEKSEALDPARYGPGLCKCGCGRLVQPGKDKSGREYQTCCQACAMHPPPAKIQHDRSCPGRPNHLQPLATAASGSSPTASPAAKACSSKLKLPDIFREKQTSEIALKHYGCAPDPSWPDNPDIQWRFVTLARNLSLPMPRPFQAPYIPGLTVLIPHYGEQILPREQDLFWEDEFRGVALIDWLKRHWDEEFKNFHARKQANLDVEEWPATGNQWDEYTDKQWDALTVWSSMRMQTLWRTVAGMCLYYPALQLHYEAQAKKGTHKSRLAHKTVWDPSDCFTCLVSMQMYKFFGQEELADTNRMFRKFPDCLKVAFIDCEEKGTTGDIDTVHSRQRRRYFSCLIDRNCIEDTDGRRQPYYRIELPGYPILGDGKSDNQNHAIPFMRGTFSQCIDANQGAYFEQMLLLPCVLGEFRSQRRGDGGGKKIIGLPEHITSDIGSVGDMAASAEVAFGTILQRTYSVLGARMHYGHPDIMNKQYMMQQGGVSKATKTLNLSEDIFAGMDFTLRGQGREIKHCEYFHLAKGRDLGFNTVLGFFSKLASGAGEQILTRQMYRIGQVFHLPDALTFHYAHVGYYLNQFLMSWSMPCLILVWLLVLLSDCDESFAPFQYCQNEGASTAQIMSRVLSAYFSWLYLLFLVATSLPLFVEIWIERSLKIALTKLVKQIATLSPLLFIFQAKVIGHYIVNELRFGGATYVSTGRGLPTERRWFIGEPNPTGLQLKNVGGLYLDYATIAYYDGFILLLMCILVNVAGGVEASAGLAWLWVSIALIIASWLLAPFIFNPYQFVRQRFQDDCRAWCAFFFEKRGQHWVKWYENTQLKSDGNHRFAIDISVFFAALLLLTLGELVGQKVEALSRVYSEMQYTSMSYVSALAPPIFFSLTYSIVAFSIESLLWFCSGFLHKSTKGDEEAPEAAEVKERWCRAGTPVAISAGYVCILTVAEMFFTLRHFYSVGWKNGLIAGLVFKYSVLVICLRLAESTLRTKCFKRVECIRAPLRCWVHAQRMVRDLIVSAVILLLLAPWVLLNSLNDYLCLGCSVHKLLIYRDGGHFARERLDFDLAQLKSGKTAVFGHSSYCSEQSRGSLRPGVRSQRSQFRSERTRPLDGRPGDATGDIESVAPLQCAPLPSVAPSQTPCSVHTHSPPSVTIPVQPRMATQTFKADEHTENSSPMQSFAVPSFFPNSARSRTSQSSPHAVCTPASPTVAFPKLAKTFPGQCKTSVETSKADSAGSSSPVQRMSYAPSSARSGGSQSPQVVHAAPNSARSRVSHSPRAVQAAPRSARSGVSSSPHAVQATGAETPKAMITQAVQAKPMLVQTHTAQAPTPRQMQVVCPQGCVAGSSIMVTAPDGRNHRVVVPASVATGQTFMVQI